MLAAGVSLGKTEAEVKFNERETAALQAVLIAALEARLLAGLLSLLLSLLLSPAPLTAIISLSLSMASWAPPSGYVNKLCDEGTKFFEGNLPPFPFSCHGLVKGR